MTFDIIITQQARELAASLDFKQLLQQVCCPSYQKEREQDMAGFGSMFFHPDDMEELKGHIRGFKDSCTIPPFIVSDLECGAGSMVRGATVFPSAMALSQTNSPELAYEAGRIAAEEAGELGYNWTFSPVVDLACEPDSPVVGLRSPGADPDHAAVMAGAYMRGLQDHGMMATIKHFPGDGHSTYDQHLTTPENPLDMDTWREQSGKVFKRLIEEGAMCVMPGHIALPAYDERDAALGLYPPATLSRRLLQELLRGELGFKGLIVSDAIGMGGAVGFASYYDACALALENGCDCLLFPKIDQIFYTEMQRRVDRGMLTLEALRERAARILSLKEQLGILKPDTRPLFQVDKEKNRQISDAVVEQSITVIRDRKSLLPFPIHEDTRILHVAIMNDAEEHREVLEGLRNEIRTYTGQLDCWVDPGPDALFEAACHNRYDLIICSIGSELSYGLNVVRLHGRVARNMMQGWMKLDTPVIFVAHFHPFVHREYQASADTVINTYGNTAHTAKCLMEGITGKRELSRTLHVHSR